MPLYVRTKDNVVLRFEDMGDLQRWASEGKVTRQAAYLADGNVWKPIEGLLNFDNLPKRPQTRQYAPKPEPQPVAPKQDTGEPAWAPKAKVILPVSDWEDELDFDGVGTSHKGLFIVVLLLVLVGAGVAGYMLFGKKILNKYLKNKEKTATHFKVPPTPVHKRIVAKNNHPKPAPPAVPAPKPVTPTTPPPAQPARQPVAHQAQVVHTPTPPPPAAHAAAPASPKPVKTAAQPPKPPAKKRPVRTRTAGQHREQRHAPVARGTGSYDHHMEMGNRLLIQGNIKAAKGHFQYALSLNPRSVEALTKIGECVLKQGNLKKAEEYFLNALSVYQEYSPAMIALARLYKREGKRSQAAAYYSKYINLHPHGLHVQEAKAYLNSH